MPDHSPTTNGRTHPPSQEELEQDLRRRFPREAVYDLMIHLAARTERYHLAVEHQADQTAELTERVRRLPCCAPSESPHCAAAE